MTLNYSHRPVFPAHRAEDNLVSSARIVNGYFIESVPDKNGDGYLRPRNVARAEAEEQDYNRRDRDSHESNAKDIIDLLPPDPFGMDIKNTFTAITGWLDDLEVAYGGYMKANNSRANPEWYGLFAGWDQIWNNSLLFGPFPNTFQPTEKSNVETFPSNIQAYEKPLANDFYIPNSIQFGEESNSPIIVLESGAASGLAPCDIGYQPACSIGDITDLGNGSASCNSKLVTQEEVKVGTDSEGVPHEALAFTLSYLGVKDLLSVEMVCKSLLFTVRADPLLWMSIHINQPLNEKITDDILVQLASRAQGNLHCLSLVECPKITDDGLRRILQTNTKLNKLCVPGCIKITIECIVSSIKTYNSDKDVGGIKRLGISGLFGVDHKHFEELKVLLGGDEMGPGSYPKPHFFRGGNVYLRYDDRAIDIELCPKCEKFRLVYDCPAAGCKRQACRACNLCIPRCAECGRCDKDTEFEETFCLEFFCSGCFKQLFYYHDKLEDEGDESI